MYASTHRHSGRSHRAFSLIELIVVMVIMVLLALIVVPQFGSRTTQARETNLRSNLKIIRTAIQSWRADTTAWPADLTKLTATSAPSGVTGWNGPYLTSVPEDPTAASVAGVNSNWTYSSSAGTVSSATTGYTTWQLSGAVKWEGRIQSGTAGEKNSPRPGKRSWKLCRRETIESPAL